MKDLTAYLASTEIAAVDNEALANAIVETVEDTESGTGSNFDFMSFSGKRSVWELGRDKEQPEEDEYFIVEPSTFSKGWTCWKSNQVVGRHEWLATEPEKAVARDDLADHNITRDGDGWKETLLFGLVRVDNLRAVKFSTTSVSGRNSVKDLFMKVADRMRLKEPAMPVVQLTKEEFTAQEQKNWKPIFDVAGWLEPQDAKAFLLGDIDLDQAMDGEEPKRGRRASKKRAARR